MDAAARIEVRIAARIALRWLHDPHAYEDRFGLLDRCRSAARLRVA